MSDVLIRQVSSGARIVVDKPALLDSYVDAARSAATEAGSGSRWLFNDNRLRRARSGLSRLKTGGSNQVAIAFVGDSLTAGAYHVNSVTKQLQDEYGSAGIGFFGVGWYDDGLGTKVYPGDARNYYYATYTGTWTGNYHAGSTSPSLSDTRSSEAGATIKVASEGGAVQPALSAVKLHFTGTADGVIKWRWGGGAWSANTPVQGGVGVQQALDLTGFPTAALTSSSPIDTNMVEIQVVSGSVILCGIDFQSAAPGVKVHRLGAAGATSQNWADADATALTAGWDLLDVDAVVILLGYNDGAASISAGQYNTNIGAMVSRMRTAHPLCDVLLAVPPENPAGYPVAMATYADALKGQALGAGYAFIDLQSLFGDPADTAEVASGGALPLFLSDDTHWNPAGAAISAWAFDAAMTTSVIGGAAVYDVEERARDAVGTALTAGTGIGVTVNDAGDTITIAAAGSLATLASATAAGLALMDDASASAQRTTLGLGSIATQAAGAVAITGGTVGGLTSLGVGIASPTTIVHVQSALPKLTLETTDASALYGFQIGAPAGPDASFTARGATGETRISSGRSAAWGGFLTFYIDTAEAARIDNSGCFRQTTKTVATLPAAATAGAGARHFVTDANATTFNSVVAGGGSNAVPVYSDGTNWRIG